LHTFIPDIYIAPLLETYSDESTTFKLIPLITLTRMACSRATRAVSRATRALPCLATGLQSTHT